MIGIQVLAFPNLGFIPNFPTCLVAVWGPRFPQQLNEYDKCQWIFQVKMQKSIYKIPDTK